MRAPYQKTPPALNSCVERQVPAQDMLAFATAGAADEIRKGRWSQHMGVSINRGPQWIVYNGTYFQMDDLGDPHVRKLPYLNI